MTMKRRIRLIMLTPAAAGTLAVPVRTVNRSGQRFPEVMAAPG